MFLNLQVYALTGGLAPLMPTVDLSQLKKRPPPREKVIFFFFHKTLFFQYQSCFLFSPANYLLELWLVIQLGSVTEFDPNWGVKLCNFLALYTVSD